MTKKVLLRYDVGQTPKIRHSRGLDNRNLLSHTHDFETFEKAVLGIRDRYYHALEELHEWLMTRMQES